MAWMQSGMCLLWWEAVHTDQRAIEGCVHMHVRACMRLCVRVCEIKIWVTTFTQKNAHTHIYTPFSTSQEYLQNAVENK